MEKVVHLYERFENHIFLHIFGAREGCFRGGQKLKQFETV
jgi:hypothetical protein